MENLCWNYVTLKTQSYYLNTTLTLKTILSRIHVAIAHATQGQDVLSYKAIRQDSQHIRIHKHNDTLLCNNPWSPQAYFT